MWTGAHTWTETCPFLHTSSHSTSRTGPISNLHVLPVGCQNQLFIWSGTLTFNWHGHHAWVILVGSDTHHFSYCHTLSLLSPLTHCAEQHPPGAVRSSHPCSLTQCLKTCTSILPAPTRTWPACTGWTLSYCSFQLLIRNPEMCPDVLMNSEVLPSTQSIIEMW